MTKGLRGVSHNIKCFSQYYSIIFRGENERKLTKFLTESDEPLGFFSDDTLWTLSCDAIEGLYVQLFDSSVRGLELGSVMKPTPSDVFADLDSERRSILLARHYAEQSRIARGEKLPSHASVASPRDDETPPPRRSLGR